MSNICRNFVNLCKKYTFTPTEGIALEEAVQKRRVLNSVLFDGLDVTHIKGAVEASFVDIPYANDVQRHQKEADAVQQLTRYLREEKRKAYVPASKGIAHKGRCPHAVFYTRTADGYLCIEGVIYHFSKPQISQRKADKGDVDALELYQVLKYLREFNNLRQSTKVKPEKVYLKASVYYLRFATDLTRDPARNETSFFDASPKAGNIVSIIEERYGLVPVLYKFSDTRTGIKLHMLDNYDKIYADSVKLMSTGIDKEQCSEKECADCLIKAACKFVNPPRAIKKQQVKRPVRSMLLSNAQEKAIEVEKGVWRINAGAGTGKTLTITLRLVALMNKGVKPEEILMITFTNAAAEEMRERAKLYNEEIGMVEDISGLRITTYNAFGDMILNANYAKLGFTSEPKVIDEVERYRIIANLVKDNPIDGLNYRNFAMNTPTYKGALPIVAKCFAVQKAGGYYDELDAPEVQRKMLSDGFLASTETVKKIIPLYEKYDEYLRSLNLIEFSDQEQMVFELLYKEPYLLEDFGIRHIIVDECQDNSEQQIRLLKILKDSPKFESIMIVGDDSQAIYGFRDTSPKYLIEFDRYIEDKVNDIYLLENHRSQENIIDFANKLNDMNTYKVSKSLIATRPAGMPVIVEGFCSADEEYQYVIDGIKDHLANGNKPEEIAVICYSKPELLKMADLLDKEEIPCVMMNPEFLVENSRVQAAISMLKVMQNTGDTTNLFIYANALSGGNLCEKPAAEIQKATDDALCKVLDANKIADPADRKKRIIEMAKELDDVEDEIFESFIDSLNFKPMPQALFDYANDFNSFGQETAVRRNHTYPGIVLVTAHSSKGLEWPIVYNMITKYDSERLTRTDAVEERRRLLFVSATRARDELYITSQWKSYTLVDKESKKRTPVDNQFLQNAYKAAGIVNTPKEYIDMVEQSYSAFEAKKANAKKKKKEESRNTGN